jgi:eukaryotic-like serine/threonine-protein kinase
MRVGQILRNRYKILKELGSGAFGDTYLAEDRDLPGYPQCVVKRLKSNPDPVVQQIVQRLFDLEAKKLYELGQKCDRIPKLFAHFEEGGQFYLVQEWIDGQVLDEEIVPGKTFGESYVRQLLRDTLEVLAVVHSYKVVHRDISPKNLIRRSHDSKIVLIDFGAVKELSSIEVNTNGQPRSSITIGTPGYMPYEQFSGHPQLCSDVYAVGMMGIQALTGTPPHLLPKDAGTERVIWRDRVNVNPKLADFLDKMTARAIDRPQNASEALTALQALKSPESPPKPPQNRRRFLQVLAWLGTGFAGAVVWNRLSAGGDSASQQTEVVTVDSLGQVTNRVLQVLAWLGTGFAGAVVWNRLSVGGDSASQQTEVVTVDSRGRVTNRVQATAQSYVQDLGNGVGLEMMAIPGGRFLMGSPETEVQRYSSESPQHEVTVAPFFLGKYAVTQAQWRAVAALPKVERDLDAAPSYFKGANRPVEGVSWYDAVEFCQRLSQASGRKYRLPSEAEWEYACRAGTTTPFHFGETITAELANYDGNSTSANAPKGKYRNQTTNVGSFPPNSFGLYDMHGNVWEWCADG